MPLDEHFSQSHNIPQTQVKALAGNGVQLMCRIANNYRSTGNHFFCAHERQREPKQKKVIRKYDKAERWPQKDLYPTVEEKAANLLYLIIKDHPFGDGNKRSGSLLFIYYLERNDCLRKANGEAKIPDTTIVALSLLIAASHPREKDVMIRVITNLLK